MTLLFSLFFFARADEHYNGSSRKDPIFVALENLLPNFMSDSTEKLDVGLYKFCKRKWRELKTTAHRDEFMRILETAKVNPSILGDYKALGLFNSREIKVELASGTTRSSRATMAHELQHVVDYMVHPWWFGLMNPVRTAVVEWRAAKAESEYLDLSLSRIDLAHEFRAVQMRLSPAKIKRDGLEKAFVYFRGKMVWARDDLLRDAANEKGPERMDDVLWMSTLLGHRLLSRNARAAIHLTGYVRRMAFDAFVSPVGMAVCAALLVTPFVR